MSVTLDSSREDENADVDEPKLGLRDLPARDWIIIGVVLGAVIGELMWLVLSPIGPYALLKYAGRVLIPAAMAVFGIGGIYVCLGTFQLAWMGRGRPRALVVTGVAGLAVLVPLTAGASACTVWWAAPVVQDALSGPQRRVVERCEGWQAGKDSRTEEESGAASYRLVMADGVVEERQDVLRHRSAWDKRLPARLQELCSGEGGPSFELVVYPRTGGIRDVRVR